MAVINRLKYKWRKLKSIVVSVYGYTVLLPLTLRYK